MTMNLFTITRLTAAILILFIASDVDAQQADAQSKRLLSKMYAVTGDYGDLWKMKDVQFDYLYDNFDAGKDVSSEKFIIDGEDTWARYTVHQRNVLPNMEGVAVQSLIDGVPQMTLNGKFIEDEQALGATKFIREVNPFWFMMTYKLADPSTVHTYLGSEEVKGIKYEKVSLKYKNEMTGKVADDEYILYYNTKSNLVDLFYFSLPAFGVNDPILKMEIGYDVIDGIYIPARRKSYAPNPQTGEYAVNGEYTFSNVKFNNGFTKDDFVLKGEMMKK